MKVVVGLTGTIGSGKEIVKEALEKRFNSYSVALSSLLRDEYLRKRKIKIDRKVKQDLGNELRKQYGADVLVKIAVGFMQKDKELLIINGIRNPAEAEFLRKKTQKKLMNNKFNINFTKYFFFHRNLFRYLFFI